MTREELKRIIRGPIVTLPTPMDDAYHLNLGRMAELTEWWIEQGLVKDVAPIKVAAAMGEGPDLSDDEWPLLLRTVVQAAKGRTHVLCGLKPKNTLHTIEDAKRAQDLGAVGLQVDLPMFHHSNHDDMVRFFSDISDKVDVGIMIYNTWWFGIESLDAATMLRLKDAEHVVALKWDVPDTVDYDSMREFAHVFNVIDNSGQPVRGHKNGAAGYISSVIAAYPQHDLNIWRLLQAKQYDAAQAEYDRVMKAIQAYGAARKVKSGGYRMVKGLMAAMGHPVGPPRPPTLPLDANDVAELRDVLRGLGWPVPQ